MKKILLVFLTLVIVQVGLKAQGILCDNQVVVVGETVQFHMGTCSHDFGGVWVYEWNGIEGIGLPAEGCVGSQDGTDPTYVYTTPGVYIVAYREFDMGPPINCLQPCDTLHITVGNIAPNCASNPIPAIDSVDVPLNPTLTWDAVDNTISYEVYFGEAGSMIYIEDVTTETYTPTTLNYGTDYEWQVVPKNEIGPATGCNTWSFTTELEVNINNINSVYSTAYPNPATDIINIKANSKIQKIMVVNMLGETIISTNPNTKKEIINISELNSGMYFIIIQTDNKTLNKKVFIDN